jgi:CRP/FNR family cyclic AMP-dependent transcriptional regulator
MSVRSDIELLRKVPLFADIEPVQLQVLVFSAERIEVAANETLFTAGTQVGAGHLVLKGQGEVLKEDGGEAQPIARVESGAFLGEMAMIGNLPASVTVRATTRLKVLRIKHDLFLRVCGEFPEIGTKVVQALARRLDNSMEDLRQAQDLLDRASRLSNS